MDGSDATDGGKAPTDPAAPRLVKHGKLSYITNTARIESQLPFHSNVEGPVYRRGRGVVVEDQAHIDQEITDMDLLHEIGSRMAAADPFHDVLSRIVEMVTVAIHCDSCFVYVLDKDKLVLRASKNPHVDVVDQLEIAVGQGVTGWVAEHRQAVALPTRAWADPRFASFVNLPEDRFQAFLAVPILSRGKLVGVINLQHRKPHHHSVREVRLITMLGYLVGAEVELARMEYEKLQLANELETRKVMERAKGLLQREMKIDEETAYLMMQRQSRQTRKPIREIADAIILIDDLRRGKI